MHMNQTASRRLEKGEEGKMCQKWAIDALSIRGKIGTSLAFDFPPSDPGICTKWIDTFSICTVMLDQGLNPHELYVIIFNILETSPSIYLTRILTHILLHDLKFLIFYGKRDRTIILFPNYTSHELCLKKVGSYYFEVFVSFSRYLTFVLTAFLFYSAR